MSSRRDRERDVRELAQLRIENEALRGQYQMVQDELVRSNAWANHYQAESEQKDGSKFLPIGPCVVRSMQRYRLLLISSC